MPNISIDSFKSGGEKGSSYSSVPFGSPQSHLQDGSADKAFATKPDDLSLIPPNYPLTSVSVSLSHITKCKNKIQALALLSKKWKSLL